jgi:hypothetical protein
LQADNCSALNAITPVRRGWQWWLRGLWLLLKALARGKGGRPRGVLMNTSMIHSAGWSLLKRVPCGTGDQEPHRLKRPYLLFEANFSGALAPYLETFSFVDAWGVRAMWQAAYEFPNPAQASRFFEFVDKKKLTINCCYYAYPEATTSMVRAAIELESRISDFDAKWRHLPATDFGAAYCGWLPSVQTIRDPPGQAGKTWSFTTVAIIDDMKKAEELVEQLGSSDLAIREHDKAPQKTHFARITIAGKFLQSWLEKEADHDPTSYLMFSTWFDGETPEQKRPAALDSHLRGLHSRFGRKAEDIWGSCRGYTGSGAEYFKDYLVCHEVDMGMPFSTYPGRKVADVKAALTLAGKFSKFVVVHPGCRDPEALQDDWDRLHGRKPRRRAKRPIRTPPPPGEPVIEDR